MVLKDVPQGKYFVVVGSELFPKLRTDKGYFDVRYGLHHNAPGPEWEVEVFDEQTVIEMLKTLDKWTDAEIYQKIAKAKANIYFAPPAGLE